MGTCQVFITVNGKKFRTPMNFGSFRAACDLTIDAIIGGNVERLHAIQTEADLHDDPSDTKQRPITVRAGEKVWLVPPESR